MVVESPVSSRWVLRNRLGLIVGWAVAGFVSIVLIPPDAAVAPVRWVLAVPLLFVLPGYAVLLAVFPDGGAGAPRDRLETAAVSVVLSLVAMVLLGAGLGWIAVPFTGVSVAGSLLVIVALSVGLAWIRASRDGRGAGLALDHSQHTATPLTSAVTVVLLAVLVLSAAWIGVLATGVGTPPEPVEYALVSTDSGSVRLADLPESVPTGSPVPVAVEIRNHAPHPRTFTVDTRQVVYRNGAPDESIALDEREVTAAGGSTTTLDVSIRPSARGRSRIVVRVRPGPDVSASITGAELHLWTTVLGERNASVTGRRPPMEALTE